MNNFTHLTGVLYTRNHCLYQSVMDLQIVVRVGATIVLEVVLVEGCKELKEDGGGGGKTSSGRSLCCLMQLLLSNYRALSRWKLYMILLKRNYEYVECKMYIDSLLYWNKIVSFNLFIIYGIIIKIIWC